MGKEKKVITRRDFLRSSAYAAIIGSVGFMGRGGETFQGEKLAKVVLIRHQDVIDENNNVNAEVIQSMLDEAVRTLTAKTETLEAWQQLIKPDDTVGIKTNAWGRLPTPGELEQAIKKMSGLPARRLGLKDRGVITPGYKADLVIFDPNSIIDRASFTEPAMYPEGIRYVFVNGILTLLEGKHTGAKAGQIL